MMAISRCCKTCRFWDWDADSARNKAGAIIGHRNAHCRWYSLFDMMTLPIPTSARASLKTHPVFYRLMLASDGDDCQAWEARQ